MHMLPPSSYAINARDAWVVSATDIITDGKGK